MTQSTIWNAILRKPASRIFIVAILVMVMVSAGFTPGSAMGIPLTRIDSVVSNVSVTISGVDFPVDQTFTVRMGPYGSLAIGGTVVGVKEPNGSSSFTATYAIPSSLVGASKIAIRFDSPQGFYTFDWFDNQTSGTTATATAGPTPTAGPTSTPGAPFLPYFGIPTFAITGVAQGTAVSIETNNFPANQTFTVRMGEFGSLGIGGIEVGTLETGSGGSLTATYSIPAALAARDRIAIRFDSPLGYYSYNWFTNTFYGTLAYTETPTPTATVSGTETPTPTGTLEATEETTAEATEEATATGGETETVEATETTEAAETSETETATPTPTSSTTGEATATATLTATPTATSAYVNWPYFGIPTFTISSVSRDASVTISAYNFPPNQTFVVRMGEYGTMGIGGTVIDTYETGGGGSFTATYPIPAALAGHYQLAIRLESSTSYYYAFNWFFNN